MQNGNIYGTQVYTECNYAVQQNKAALLLQRGVLLNDLEAGVGVI